MTTIISSIWNRLRGKNEDTPKNGAEGSDIFPLLQSEGLSDSVNYKNLGDNALDLDKLNEAAEFYQKTISLNPQYAEACSNLGLVFREQGKFEAAVSCLNKAISVNPQLAACRT